MNESINEKDKIEAITKLLKEVSDLLDIPTTESNYDTPKRVAKMWCNELFKNRNYDNLWELEAKMTLFDNEGTNTLIKISDIEFCSTCEHHWLPFMGVASVEYIPNKKIIGLSKIPRVVKYFSQMPQLQERLTSDIGHFLVRIIKPKYLKVTLTATHTCVMCRGAESNCSTETYFVFKDKEYYNEETC